MNSAILIFFHKRAQPVYLFVNAKLRKLPLFNLWWEDKIQSTCPNMPKQLKQTHNDIATISCQQPLKELPECIEQRRSRAGEGGNVST
jgi:hypothetical protein